MPRRPPKGYLSTAQVAELINQNAEDGAEWTTQKVRRWLTRDGALVRKGRHLYTTRSKLRVAFRDVFDELFWQQF